MYKRGFQGGNTPMSAFLRESRRCILKAEICKEQEYLSFARDDYDYGNEGRPGSMDEQCSDKVLLFVAGFIVGATGFVQDFTRNTVPTK